MSLWKSRRSLPLVSRKKLRVQVTGLFEPLVNDIFIMMIIIYYFGQGLQQFCFVFHYIKFSVLKRITYLLKSTFWYRPTSCYLYKKNAFKASVLHAGLMRAQSQLLFWFVLPVRLEVRRVCQPSLFYLLLHCIFEFIKSALCCAKVFPLCFWTDLCVACLLCWLSVQLAPIVTVQLNNIETH